MDSPAFPRLFAPLQIGPVQARNRIVFGAHFTMFTEPGRTVGEPGFFGARAARYFARRARGGAGVIIVGQAQVHPTSAYQMANNAIAWDPLAIPQFEKVTEAIHANGALAFLQLAHNGGVTFGTWSKLPAWAPSAVANSTEAPKVLEKSEIRELVDYFGRSAANAAAGGFDGIEVHAAHGYLLHEFLSPKSNRRTDEYGGSLQNRMRFAIEVLEAVRDAVGANVAVGIRLVGDEESHDGSGLRPQDAAEIAVRFEELGLVDFVNVSIGVSGIGMVRPLYVPHLCGSYAAKAVKEAVRRTPVFTVQRILTPDEAEGVIERGEADAVTLVRALIADPDWPLKAERGEAEEIRRCTGCNQGCYGNLAQGLPVTCATHPAVGREAQIADPPMPHGGKARKVVVVGGGPAGLEAAWVAAARGHTVTLLEADAEVGGKVRLAARLPGREEMIHFVDWRVDECRRRGVEVRLNLRANAESLLFFRPDVVIVATGGRATVDGASKMHPMPVPGAEQDHVIDHETALREPERVGKRVLILDAVGHIEAIGLGELLAREGREVTLVTPLPSPLLLDRETAAHALPRAGRAGVRWRPNAVLAAIGEHDATLYDTVSGRLETIEDVDTVVIRTHAVADDALYFALKPRVERVVRVGDAVAPRFVDRAIFDGHQAGASC